MAIAEWIGRRKFAAGKAEGRMEGKAEGRAEVIQALKALGHEQAVAALAEAESNGTTLAESPPDSEKA